MDFRILSYVLLLGGSSGMVQLVRAGWRWHVHQIAGLGAMTAAALAAVLSESPVAGTAAIALFVLVVALPAASRMRVDALFGRMRFRDALAHARRFSLLRPGRAGQVVLEAIEMTALVTEGEIAAAEEIYRRWTSEDLPPAMRARLDMYWVLANGFARRWQSIRAGFQDGLFTAVSGTRTFMRAQAARALAETGAPEAGMALLRDAFPDVTSAEAFVQLYVAHIACCALAGDLEGLAHAFQDPLLKRFPPYTARYWTGRCHLVRGELDEARRCFDEVEKELLPRAKLWRAAVASLRTRCDEAGPGDRPPRKGLDVAELRRQLETAWLRIRAARIFLLQDGPARVTRLLTAILVLVWVGCEIAGGSRNLGVLEAAGALVPDLIRQGQVWRLVTATFLHIGFLHLGLNALALVYFGPTVERVLGAARFLLLFLVCGAGGGLAGLLFGSYGLAAGASGAIFGILGVTIVMAWRWDWGAVKALRSRFVGSLLFLVVANFGIGLLEGGIDDLGHLGGLLTGMLFGFVFASRPPAPHRARRRSADPLVWLVSLGILLWGTGRGLSWFVGRKARLSAPSMTVVSAPDGSYRIFLPAEWPRKRDSLRLSCSWYDGTEILILSTTRGELPPVLGLDWLERESAAYLREYGIRPEFTELRPRSPRILAIGDRLFGRISLEYRLFGRLLTDELYFPADSPRGPIIRLRFESRRREDLRPLFDRILASLAT